MKSLLRTAMAPLSTRFGFQGLVLCSYSVTCYAQATHIYIYSFFPAFRAPSFLYNILIYTHIIPTAPSGLDIQ